MSWSREEFGKETLIADLEDVLEKLDASEIYPRRINAKEVLISQTGDEFIFPAADGIAKLSGWDDDVREPTLRRKQTVRREDFSGDLQGEPGESQPPIYGRFKVASSVIITMNLQLPPRAEGRNIPHSTETHWCNKVNLHWSGPSCQKKRVDDYWNVDSNRIERKNLTMDTCGPVRDWQKFKRLPDQTQMYGQKNGRAAQNREKHEWANAKAKCSIMFGDREDFTLLILMTKVTKKLFKCEEKIGKTYGSDHAVQKESFKLAPRRWLQSRTLQPKRFQKRFHGCAVECHESTRQRVESSLLTQHEDHIAGKGCTSMTQHNLVHKFIPMPQAMRTPDAKAAVDKEMEKELENHSIENGESQEQEGGYSRNTQRQTESLPHLLDKCHI